MIFTSPIVANIPISFKPTQMSLTIGLETGDGNLPVVFRAIETYEQGTIELTETYLFPKATVQGIISGYSIEKRQPIFDRVVIDQFVQQMSNGKLQLADPV